MLRPAIHLYRLSELNVELDDLIVTTLDNSMTLYTTFVEEGEWLLQPNRIRGGERGCADPGRRRVLGGQPGGILPAADPRLDECITWQAPTFTYKGNLASFFPKSKSHVSLMFHKGAAIEGDFPNLVGDGKEARTMRFSDLDDLAAKHDELQAVARAWCDQRDR